jgi:hemerythrin-like domain-containing protein
LKEDDLIFEIVQNEQGPEESKQVENIMTEHAGVTVVLKEDIRNLMEQDLASLKRKIINNQLPL